jgi:hypothetical protein
MTVGFRVSFFIIIILDTFHLDILHVVDNIKSTCTVGWCRSRGRRERLGWEPPPRYLSFYWGDARGWIRVSYMGVWRDSTVRRFVWSARNCTVLLFPAISFSKYFSVRKMHSELCSRHAYIRVNVFILISDAIQNFNVLHYSKTSRQ